MRSGVIAQKVGMTRVYNDDGVHVPVTVLRMENCQVVAQRTQEKNGYTAVQLGVGLAKVKNTSKALRGHFAAASVEPKAQARRVPGFARQSAGGRRGADGRAFRARPEGRRHRDEHRQGLPGRHEALELRRRSRHARQLGVAPHARFDRPAPGPRQGVQGQEDGRPHGLDARHHAERRGRAGRSRPRADPHPGRGSGCQGRLDPGARRRQGGAAGERAEAGRRCAPRRMRSAEAREGA